MTKIRAVLAVFTCVFSIFVTNQVLAAGFAIIEQSASGQGNAYAGGAAAAEDASTIFFNPAGMMKLDRQFIFAGHMIIPKSEFSNEDSQTGVVQGSTSDLSGGNDDGGKSKFVPNLYAVFPTADDLRFGIGINAPFGLATEYKDTWVGRYHAVESDVATVNINPSMAVKINKKLDVGFGLNFQYLDVTLSNAVDFGSICINTALANGDPAVCAAAGMAPQQNDGFVEFTGDNQNDIGIGWNLGFLYQATPETRIGLAYRSAVDHKLEGEADFTVPASAAALTSSGAFADSDIEAEVTLPRIVSLSMYHEIDKVAIMADFTHTKWDVFDELRIEYDNAAQPDSVTTESWDNSLRYSLGASYKLNRQLTLRGGIAVDQTPIPSAERRTPRVPGNDRKWLSFGASYYIDRFTIDVGYSHLFISDAKINNEFESSSEAANHTLIGSYENTVDIISAQLRWYF